MSNQQYTPEQITDIAEMIKLERQLGEELSNLGAGPAERCVASMARKKLLEVIIPNYQERVPREIQALTGRDIDAIGSYLSK